jgi:hypothetical protein
VLLAEAQLLAGDPGAAVTLLAPIASDTSAPSLLFARRHALASYASALLADGRPDAALTWIRRAETMPAEDVRSRVVTALVLARVLLATGSPVEARVAAEEAVGLAYSTQQTSERIEAETLRDAMPAIGDVELV